MEERSTISFGAVGGRVNVGSLLRVGGDFKRDGGGRTVGRGSSGMGLFIPVELESSVVGEVGGLDRIISDNDGTDERLGIESGIKIERFGD